MEQKRQIAWELFNASLKEGKRASLKSQGSCMEPLFGSDALITFVKKNNFKFGDLVVYRDNSSLVAHRFMYKRMEGGQELLILKADNSWKPDGPVSINSVLGVITEIEENGSTITLDTPGGKIRSIYSFFIAHLRLIAKIRLPARQVKYGFNKELDCISLLIKENISQTQRAGLKILLEDKLDWKYLREKIKWNFIAPIFMANIRRLGLERSIPQEALLEIDNLNLVELALDVKKRAALETILAEFRQKGVDTFITKGTQLGLEVYEQSFHRWMGDIDLIVKPQQYIQALEGLEKIGFRPCGEAGGLNPWALGRLDTHYDLCKDEVRVELKSNLWAVSFPYFDFDYWRNARKTQIGEAQAFFPSCEDTLLISCVSLARHNFSGLLWFLDIKNIITNFGAKFDWEKFVFTAKRYDLGSIAFHSLEFTNILFDVAIPRETLDRLDPGVLKKSLFGLLWDRRAILLKKEKSTFRIKLPFEFALIFFAGKFSFRLKKAGYYIKAIFTIFFPPRDYILDRYGLKESSGLLIKYYLSRLYKAAILIWRSIFKAFRQG